MSRYRILLGLLILLNLFLMYHILAGRHGLVAYVQLKSEYDELQAQIRELNESNLELSRTIRLLKNDDEYVENTIRTRLHYVRPNEIIYAFPENSEQETSGAEESGK